ncbi:MAG: UDP-N-acetylmuramoyl-L-alanyl-D-glutamate--2,6-diaminopimelate ligase [Cyclobacteriaceae bacterium]|jgi:UDP-N-acetylmuramoyl-L-alanyl-D-glutamate--2,6-diaminopimelate ligase|nr:UDP-N-acetylmuramoyl-L-alanyl-D-glutamate--2,6-diaminopimelate ligase [Cyclobacteriaceae bacterium]
MLAKLLKDILYNVSLKTVSGDMNTVISSLSFDSRESKADSLFVAVKGTQVDGHDYIDKALDNGAVGIVCEKLPGKLRPNITYIETLDSSLALGFIASIFYDNPSKKLQLVAITGTNGKTTTATLLYNLFRDLGYATGLLSTVNNFINGVVISATHTTPDSLSLNQLLGEMVKEGCTHAFMEVSSHAIDQNRVSGIHFTGAVFTNISHDHLDYHETFDNYITAKKKLFDNLPSSAFALVNLDDKRGQVMLQNTKAQQFTFGLKFLSDFKAKIVSNSLQGLELEIEDRNVWFRLIGTFNAYNILTAYAVGVLLEEDKENLLTTLSAAVAAPGRFEQINVGSGVLSIVDYAHTPDALENVLQTIASFRTKNEQVITVVGCGGNRDKTKRPVMGSIAVKWSDKVIFTNDNPRNEDPDQILRDIQAGVSKLYVKKTLVISDRKEAIKTACALAKQNDIILVAGKGHEDYQEINGVKHHFDDREVLKEMLELFKV